MDQTLEQGRREGWPQPPYAWILAPLLVFVAIALGATFIQYRRRRAARRREADHAERIHGGRGAGWRQRQQQQPGRRGGGGAGGDDDRDLEQGWSGRGRRWVGMRRRDDEAVEGLDEHGLAPPPYEPAGAKKADVELREVGGDGEGRPPGYEEDDAAAADAAVLPPPAAVTHAR